MNCPFRVDEYKGWVAFKMQELESYGNKAAHPEHKLSIKAEPPGRKGDRASKRVRYFQTLQAGIISKGIYYCTNAGI
jgi:hypothetical protein